MNVPHGPLGGAQSADFALPQQQNRLSDSAALWICDAGHILLKGYGLLEKSVKAF